MKSPFSKVYLVIITIFCLLSNLSAKEVIKVLAIGNSFSEDAVEQYLYELAEANGDSLVVANAYIGGCSLQRHYKNAQDDASAYRYRKIVGGSKQTHPSKASLQYMIAEEEWDYISLQQASSFSGVDSTYWALPALVHYVKQYASNPQLHFLFHQTWAYAQSSTHKGFKTYKNDQKTMYKAIMKTVKKQMKKNKIPTVVPSGTAIQNARATVIGDNLCRDGYHLSKLEGRYIAACVWLEVLTGKSAVGNSFVPSGITPERALLAQQAAHAAVKKPWKTTTIK